MNSILENYSALLFGDKKFKTGLEEIIFHIFVLFDSLLAVTTSTPRRIRYVCNVSQTLVSFMQDLFLLYHKQIRPMTNFIHLLEKTFLTIIPLILQ